MPHLTLISNVVLRRPGSLKTKHNNWQRFKKLVWQEITSPDGDIQEAIVLFMSQAVPSLIGAHLLMRRLEEEDDKVNEGWTNPVFVVGLECLKCILLCFDLQKKKKKSSCGVIYNHRKGNSTYPSRNVAEVVVSSWVGQNCLGTHRTNIPSICVSSGCHLMSCPEMHSLEKPWFRSLQQLSQKTQIKS